MKRKQTKTLSIIPARGGSKGLPRKNLRLLAGKPLVAYPIEAAKNCRLIDRVIVSTDDQEIAEIARQYGAEVPFLRPEELGGDLVTSEQVLNHALDWLEKNEGYIPDIVVYLQPTDVFRTQYMVDEVVKRMLADENLDTVFCAYREHKNYWKKSGDTYVPMDQRGHLPRQIKEPVYREDTGLACATRPHVIRSGRRIGNRVDIVVHTDQATAIDIHEPYDLFLAEKTLTEWGRRVNQ